MIYIINKYFDMAEKYQPHMLWEVDCNDVESEYKAFMADKAEKLKIVIHPYWLNIMNHRNHHPNLSEAGYIAVEKKWKKILKQWNIDKFISEVLKGKELKFKEVNRI